MNIKMLCFQSLLAWKNSFINYFLCEECQVAITTDTNIIKAVELNKWTQAWSMVG